MMSIRGQSITTAADGDAAGASVAPPEKKLRRVSLMPCAEAGPAPERPRRPMASAPRFVHDRIETPPVRVSGKALEPRSEAVQRHRDADALLRGLEHDEGGRLPLLELVDQVVFHDDLGDAARGQAADEAGPAHVGLIDLEAEARRKQDPERREDAQEAAPAVRGL